MDTLRNAGEIQDIDGQTDTNVGNMLNRIKKSMKTLLQREIRKLESQIFLL